MKPYHPLYAISYLQLLEGPPQQVFMYQPLPWKMHQTIQKIIEKYGPESYEFYARAECYYYSGKKWKIDYLVELH